MNVELLQVHEIPVNSLRTRGFSNCMQRSRILGLAEHIRYAGCILGAYFAIPDFSEPFI